MAGVKDVEAAIGEDDLLAVGAGVFDCQQQLLQAQHATLGTLLALHRATQFGRADRRGTQLADHDAGGQVGQAHRGRQLLAGGKRRGQGGDDRIAGTGDVEHFPRPRRQVQGRLAMAEQGHAMLAAGHQQGTEVEFAHQRLALGDQFGFVGATADDGLEFGQVRGDQAGAAIDGEVLALGIGQYRNVARPRRLDQHLVVL
ncbi:Uncharacterised protein [Acinetobacter baumannii]|nr:Uncharacterised protein [Acinetobacter baumannii]